MNARLDDPTTTSDPILRGILIMTMAITIVGMLALIRAAVPVASTMSRSGWTTRQR